MSKRESPDIEKQRTLEALRGGVIVSVQASTGEPLNDPAIIAAMAHSAVNGGAKGLRLANVENIKAVKAKNLGVPVIGITKPDKIPANYEELVYITPNFADVQALAEAGADIVALDATDRERPNSESLSDVVAKAKATYPDLLLMADVSSFKEGQMAGELGFDLVSTTLSGYTTASNAKKDSGPDFQLLETLVNHNKTTHGKTPVILEGRVWKPWEVTHAMGAGAFALVIGSAITRPHEITQRCVKALGL